MEKIYFVLYAPGYWRGLATTNKKVALKEVSKDASYKLKEAELMEIDFTPLDMTWVSRFMSRTATKVELEEYLCFHSNYKSEPSGKWLSTVKKSILPLLETGVYCESFDEGIYASEALHIKMP